MGYSSMITVIRTRIIPEMGILRKPCIPVGDMEIDIRRDRKGEFEPQIVKNIRIGHSGHGRKRLSPCMPKG